MTVAGWQDERFAWASREAGASLYPVGTADEGAGFLGITEDGALYFVRDRVELLADTTDRPGPPGPGAGGPVCPLDARSIGGRARILVSTAHRGNRP